VFEPNGRAGGAVSSGQPGPTSKTIELHQEAFMAVEEVFERIPIIETPRLTLRQIDLHDAEDIFATFSDEVVMEYYGELPHQSVEDSRELIRRQQAWYARREGIRWGITRQGEDRVVGSCGLFSFDDGFHRATLGYELGRAYWRQGVMTEALNALLTFAFATMGLRRVEAVVDQGNDKSQALLRKLGFTHEGTLRQRFWFRDRFWDEHYFGILSSEWRTTAKGAD
jgi:[ribosomal protein S5]-alanine N-acetyltransferase